MTCEKRTLKEAVRGGTARPEPATDLGRSWASPSLSFPRMRQVPSPLEGEAQGAHTHAKDTTVTGTRRQHTPCLHVAGLLTGLGLSVKEGTAGHAHRGGCQLTVNQQDSPSFPVSSTRKHAHLPCPWGISETIIWTLHQAVFAKDVADTVFLCIFSLEVKVKSLSCVRLFATRGM